jgi:hypothetical protein
VNGLSLKVMNFSNFLVQDMGEEEKHHLFRELGVLPALGLTLAFQPGGRGEVGHG